jgi:hypothetical protein
MLSLFELLLNVTEQIGRVVLVRILHTFVQYVCALICTTELKAKATV